MRFVQKTFDELAARDLHDLLSLRISVFVVEQSCPYPELDGHDPHSVHLLGFEESELVSYARWYPGEGQTVLGRIVVRREARGRGLGRLVSEEALRRIGYGEIRLSAQLRLESFYRELGFRTVSEVYEDYGLAHVDMVRSALERPSA